MTSKTIIISSNGSSGRGILSLILQDEILQCRLRLYDMPALNSACKLGVYHKEQVYSANLLFKNGVYTSSLVGDFDMNQDFYSAIVDTSENNKVLLSGGTYAGFFFNEDVFNSQNNDDLTATEQNVVDSQESQHQVFKEQESQVLDNQQENCNSDCEKCANCKYKEYFYSDAKIEDVEKIDKLEQIETEKSKQEKTISLLDSIIPQFDYIFSHYDADEQLSAMLPNSKFVKIVEGQESYSIGVLYENDQIKYLCYAVFANYNSAPPIELGDHYQWLPIDKEDPLSEGYYIVFQDATDLKIVEL